MEVPLIYEDEYALVFNKPSGLPVHGASARPTDETLQTFLAREYPELEKIGEEFVVGTGEKLPRFGIMHRLDRETSGVILVAKTEEAFQYFKKQFHERSIEKRYDAFVYGRVRKQSGFIDQPIGRSKSSPTIRSAEYGARGKLRAAVTLYRRLQATDEASLLELSPKTGRTHQIRVHLKALGHPVVCDRLYAPRRAPILGFNRLALHARSLSFTLPSGARITVEAPLPEDFERARALLLRAL